MLCSDTFPTMPIKHLRRGCFVTHSKITICYPLIINAKHGYIENFHQYFFNLPPDNDYIKWTVGKAMYMADGTALKQKQALDENGFYSLPTTTISSGLSARPCIWLTAQP